MKGQMKVKEEEFDLDRVRAKLRLNGAPVVESIMPLKNEKVEPAPTLSVKPEITVPLQPAGPPVLDEHAQAALQALRSRKEKMLRQLTQPMQRLMILMMLMMSLKLMILTSI